MTEVSLSTTPARTERVATPGQRYSLTVCSSPKLVWFRNAKVGTRTLLKLLRDASVEFEIEHEFRVPFDAARYRSHYKFAVVRNPWDRLVSGWKNKIYPRQKTFLNVPQAQADAFRDFTGFARFIATKDGETCDVHFRRQTALISVDDMDHIARFERFDDGIKELFAALGLKVPEVIPRENRSKVRRPYQSYYDAESRSIVEHFYRSDIETFGYTFDED